MTLKTSLIITGDSSTAQAAVEELRESVDKLGTGSRATATAQGALTTATNATNASARGAIVAQTGAAASTTAIATTSRAAAMAQGALAVGTNVATGALASFGVTAMSVQAILTGGLSLALTAGIAFLTGFAGELFTAGAEAEDAAPKVDKLTDALRRLRQEQANAGDIGEVEKKLNSLRDERLKASISLDNAANTRAGQQQRLIASRRIADLNAEIGSLQSAIAMNEAVAKSQEKTTETTQKSTAATRTHGRAHRDSSDAARAAAQAQRQLEADLNGVIGRYDPARKAASDYADELERIAKLEKAGKISPEDAGDYRAQANAGYLGSIIDWAALRQ